MLAPETLDQIFEFNRRQFYPKADMDRRNLELLPIHKAYYATKLLATPALWDWNVRPYRTISIYRDEI